MRWHPVATSGGGGVVGGEGGGACDTEGVN